MARSPWPFQDLAFRFTPVLVAVIGWNAIWTWATPLDRAWLPPPRDQTVLTIGVFTAPTNGPQADGYAFETVDGRQLRLRCRPTGAAKDECLSRSSGMGNRSGQSATVRYYVAGERAGQPARPVLLGAKSGKTWLLRTSDQTAWLKQQAQTEQRRKVHWRTAISAVLTLAAGFVGLLLYRRFRR